MTVLGLARVGPDPLIDGLCESIGRAGRELGHQVVSIERPEDEAGVDVLLVVGYPGAYRSFLDGPRTARRIAWFGEPLPRAIGADAGIGARRSRLRQRFVAGGLTILKRSVGPATRRHLPSPVGRLREAALIAAEQRTNLADAIRCARSVDRIVVTSRDRSLVLAGHGVAVTVVPFGYDAASSGPIVPPNHDGRDIAIAAVGSGIAERRLRRGRLLASLEPAVRDLGPLIHLEGVWGPERDALLARTRVVLDVHRIPGNFTGLRFLTTLAAGAVLVTEPLDDPHPFVAGEDHVAAPIARMPRAIAALLADESRRVAIAGAGQRRLTADLSMRTSLERVLAA